MTYDNSGKGALWSNQKHTENPKAPKWTGRIVADRDIKQGEEIPLAVWPGDRKSEKSPVMRLQISRRQVESRPKVEEQFDDSIPW